MVKLILTLLITLVVSASKAQTQPPWLAPYGLSGQNSRIVDIAEDDAHNRYVYGLFSGAQSIGSVAMTAMTASDFFIAKFDPQGAVLWAKQGGWTINFDNGGIVVDRAGNVYANGICGSTLFFDGDSVLGGPGTGFYLLKLNTNGELQWIQKFKAKGWAEAGYIGKNMALANNNEIYFTGSFSPDSIAFGSHLLISQNTSAFIAKFDSAGAVQWARKSNGQSGAQGFGICADPSGNIAITGLFVGPDINFGAQSHVPVTNDGYNGFMAKYTSSGNLIWSGITSIKNGEAFGLSCAADLSGNTYFVGSQSGTIFLSQGDSIPGSGSFLIKYDPQGNYVWSRTLGASVSSIKVDVTSQPVITGQCLSCYFPGDPIMPPSPPVPATGFAVCYNNAGTFQWVLKAFATTGNSVSPHALLLTNDGAGFVAGRTNSCPATFGTNTVCGSNSGSAFMVPFADYLRIENGGLPTSPGLNVYPIPATSRLYIIAQSMNRNLSVIIRNSLGQPIYTGSSLPINGTHILNLSGIRPGTYWLSCTNNSGTPVGNKMIVVN